MADFKCKKCGKDLNLRRHTSTYVEADKKFRVKEAMCCGDYMEEIYDLDEEIKVPNIERTEPSLRKNFNNN